MTTRTALAAFSSSLLLPLVLTAFVLAPLVLTSGCGEGNGAVATDYTPLLQTLTVSVAMPRIQAAATGADALATAAHALASAANAQTLAAAQAAWREARATWRSLDAFYFGPVADDLINVRIDTAPATPSKIDAVISGSAAIDLAYVGTLGGQEKGFLALEYLLFAKSGAAAALPSLQGDGAAARRRALVAAEADEIAASLHTVYDGWDPAKGGFATQLTTAGKASTRYPRQRGAVDDYVAGVAYSLEWVVGIRLATVLGRKTPGGAPDPELDVTARSDNAVNDMKASLEGVAAGYAGAGFSSLVKVASIALEDRAQQQMKACSDAVAAIPAPFDTALVSNTPVVQAAFDACKTWKRTWNTDVTVALGATMRSLTNDGD